MTRIVKPRSSIQRYYEILFTLPHPILLLIPIILVYLLIYVLLKSLDLLIIYTIWSTLYYLLHILGFSFLKSPLLIIKRILGLYLVVNIYTFIIMLITNLVFHNTLLVVFIGLMSMNIILLPIYVGIHGFDKRTIAIYLTVFLLTSLVNTIVSVNIRYFISSIPIPLIGLSIMVFINRYRINNYGAVDLGALFLRNWLSGDKSIEKVFQKHGVKRKIHTRIFYDDRIAIIYPDIHFGPFRNTGSSMFPSMIREVFSQRNMHPIVLHGMGSHERNVVTSTEAIQYVKYIYEKVAKDEGIEILVGMPFKVKYYDWEALVIPFSKAILTFISRPRKGIDDLPYSIQEYALDKSSEYNLPPLILIDSHNWEAEDKIDQRSLIGLVDKIVDELMNRQENYFEPNIGLAIHEPNDFLGIIDDMVFLAINVGGRKIGILYVPGNNMVPGLRDKIINVILNEGYDLSEVLTNDEHRETGLFSDYVYTPVQYSQKLLDTIKEMANEALRTTSKSNLRCIFIERDLHLMGDLAWKLLELLEEVFYKSLILNILYIALTPIVFIILLSI